MLPLNYLRQNQVKYFSLYSIYNEYLNNAAAECKIPKEIKTSVNLRTKVKRKQNIIINKKENLFRKTTQQNRKMK